MLVNSEECHIQLTICLNLNGDHTVCQPLNFLSSLTKWVFACVFPGAEQASITVRTNIQVAQSQVAEARKLSADADKKLAETKVEEIQRMAEYTAFLEASGEHEVHEAYLRED